MFHYNLSSQGESGSTGNGKHDSTSSRGNGSAGHLTSVRKLKIPVSQPKRTNNFENSVLRNPLSLKSWSLSSPSFHNYSPNTREYSDDVRPQSPSLTVPRSSKLTIENLLNPVEREFESQRKRIKLENSESALRCETSGNPLKYSHSAPATASVSQESSLEMFKQKNPDYSPERHPLTSLLISDMGVDKFKKKKGGYRCSGSTCKDSCTFATILELAKHLDDLKINNEFKCWVENCPYRYIGFNTSGSLKRHGKVHQLDSHIYKCVYCNKGFRNEFNKHRHEQNIHQK